jgi:hypothetical protein
MFTRRTALAVLAGASLAACDRAGQQLPFDSASTDPVTRTVPAQGATVSTAAGASVQLPAGAVPAGTEVTLTPTAAGASASGTAASAYAFNLQPAGLALASAATVDLRMSGGRADAWLASVVVATPGGAAEDGDATVDLNNGLVRGRIATLGTVQAVIPEAGAVLRARPLGTALRSVAPVTRAQAAITPTRALRGDCGGPGRRCAGLDVEVSQNLLGMVDTAAVVFPRLSGQITVQGASASGSLVLVAPLRVRLSAGSTAVTVPSRITATATPQTVVLEAEGRTTLTNVRVVGESAGERGETLATLTVEHAGAQAWIRLEHQFDATIDSGARERVTVAARVPLVRTY